MSIKIMAKVWEYYPGGGTELLSLLALADWSDDDGRCFPSMAAISHKTRLSRSQAQRVVHGLIGAGFVKVMGNEFGGPPGATRQYQIVLDRLTGRIGATGSAHATGRTDAQDGSHGCAETGRTGATQTTIEPSITVSKNSAGAKSSKSAGLTLRRFIDECKASGEKPIPDDDPIFEYVAKVGIDSDMLAVCWHEFKTRHLPGLKRQKDWRAHFRNAVHRNWYKLWFIKDGELAQWTTAGEQARRAAA